MVSLVAARMLDELGLLEGNDEVEPKWFRSPNLDERHKDNYSIFLYGC